VDISYIIIAIAIIVLTVPTVNASSGRVLSEEERESGFYDEDGYPKQADRPAINPDFAPDYSCLFDIYQAKCIPSSEQECPEGLGGNNDDETCVLLSRRLQY
jgi:hypothetical protein